MRTLALGVLVLALMGCGRAQPGAGTDDNRITVWHDDARNVTCWIYDGVYGDSISCVRDE